MEIRRERVLKWIDLHHEDIVDFLQELVRIPSVNPWFHETPGPSRENEVQAVIAERLKTLGAMVEQWEPDSGKLAKYEGYPGYYAGRDFHGVVLTWCLGLFWSLRQRDCGRQYNCRSENSDRLHQIEFL